MMICLRERNEEVGDTEVELKEKRNPPRGENCDIIVLPFKITAFFSPG